MYFMLRSFITHVKEKWKIFTDSSRVFNLIKCWIWWIGFPIFAFVATFVPYFMAGHGWRIRVLPQGIYDTYVYLHWVNAAVQGGFSGEFGWFVHILRGIWFFGFGQLSFPELWLISRWITITLTAWVFAYALEKWTSVSKTESRFIAISAWLSYILVLGGRPGIYSWYLPFCLIGLSLTFIATKELFKHHLWRSAIIFMISIAISNVYFWFFFYQVLWGSVCLGWYLVKRYPRFFWIAASLAIVAIPFVSYAVGMHGFDQILLDKYGRHGVNFSRFPTLVKTVLAMVVWISAFFFLAKRFVHKNVELSRIFSEQCLIWTVLFFCWFQNSFTGFFLYADHFINLVYIFSWVGFSVIWAHRVAIFADVEQYQRISKWISRGLLAVSSIILLHVLLVSFRSFKDLDVFLGHFTIWMPMVAALLIVSCPQRRIIEKTSILIIGFSVVLGMAASCIVAKRILERSPDASVVNAIESIRTLPRDVSICSDPNTADFFAAHTEYPIFPAEATLTYLVPEKDIQDRLYTLVGAYDVRSAGTHRSLQFFSEHFRTSTCDFGFGMNERSIALVMKMGFGQYEARKMAGCPIDLISRLRTDLDAAIDRHVLDGDRFRSACPYVLIPDEQQSLWQLPDSYTSTSIGGGYRLWKTSR